jgi:protoheme IX farnesyltransferase
VLLGVVAYVWYIAVYGFAKRTTAWSTLIGGVPGALPPVAGYTALTGTLDIAALILFLILFFWQIPHFYAISMFRRDDYAKAGLPVWAVRFGLSKTKAHIMVSVLFFALTVPLLTLLGYTGIIYMVGAIGLALYWVYKGITLYSKYDDVKWARTMFGISLLVLLAMIFLIAVGGFLV